MSSELTKRPRRMNRFVAYALMVASLALSLAGCTSNKPAKQPNTIKEFLSQPRPQ